MDWRSRAACLEEDPELFFPIGNTGPAIAQAERAKMVCARCEVESICLSWALDNNQDAGVFLPPALPVFDFGWFSLPLLIDSSVTRRYSRYSGTHSPCLPLLSYSTSGCRS